MRTAARTFFLWATLTATAVGCGSGSPSDAGTDGPVSPSCEAIWGAVAQPGTVASAQVFGPCNPGMTTCRAGTCQNVGVFTGNPSMTTPENLCTASCQTDADCMDPALNPTSVPAACAPLPSSSGMGLCLRECASQNSCGDGFECDVMAGGPSVCVPVRCN